MRKLLSICLLLVCVFSLSSCYQDLYYDSLEEYAEYISQSKLGHSGVELDHPTHFLPSNSFINDFEYIDGEYNFYEEDLLRLSNTPSISLLWLRYEEETYLCAKDYMTTHIPMHGNKIYTYNSYVFYQNANFVTLKGESRFPDWFTMACYNDTNCTLVFIGFCGFGDDIPVLENDNDWKDFIDKNYGKYYNFSADVAVEEPSDTPNVDVSDTANVD